MAQKIKVYAPDGTEESHTLSNARDLINGAGYTWSRSAPTTPASLAPFAVPPNKTFTKSKAQEILDAVTGSAAAEDNSSDADGDSGAEEVVEEAPEEASETVGGFEAEASVAEPAAVEAAPAPRTRRSRNRE